MKNLSTIEMPQDFEYLVVRNIHCRFFNEIQIEGSLLKKSSTDSLKLKREWNFYQYLPSDQKRFFVRCQSFARENKNVLAQLTMDFIAELTAAACLSLDKYSNEDFLDLINHIFNYLEQRPTTFNSSLSQKSFESLFIIKPMSRLNSFEEWLFQQNSLPLASIKREWTSIKRLMNMVLSKLEGLGGNALLNKALCISHGDLVFSNILSGRDKNYLFIDPRGIDNEQSLWIHPLYDYCKVFQGLYLNYDEIVRNHEQRLPNLPSTHDRGFEAILEKFFSDKGFDINLIKLGTLSLLISFLPFHTDSDLKICEFLNVFQIRAHELLDSDVTRPNIKDSNNLELDNINSKISDPNQSKQYG